METAAISIPTIPSGTGSATKTGAPAETSFSQVLSREVAGRQTASEPSKPAVKENSAAPQASQATAGSTKNKVSEGNKATSANEAGTRPAAEGEPDAVEGTKADTAADAQPEDEETALAAAASDELLALVANMNQAATALRTTTDKVPPPDTAGIASTQDLAIAKKVFDLAQHAVHAQGSSSETADQKQIANVPDGASSLNMTASDAPVASNGFDTALASANASAQATDRNTTQSVHLKAAQAANTNTNTNINADANAIRAKDMQAPQTGAVTQTSDVKTVPELMAVKNAPGQMEFTAATDSADIHAAKPAQDIPVAAPVNFATQSQAPLQQVQQAAAQATERLAPRVGSPGWDQALGQKVVWMVSGEQQSASLTLNPPDLGPLEVVLNVSNSQATANFTAAQPEVRQALEAAMPKLREMLSEAGIQLGQANVSAGMPNNQQGTSGERQQSSRRGEQTADSTEAPVHVTRSQPISGGQGLVDTFV